VEKIFPPIYAEKHRVSPKVSSCFAEALICSLTANQRSLLQVKSLQKSKDFFQLIEKPNGKSFNSWVLLSVGDFLFGCGSSALGLS
jgi:hypothetical protein